MVTCSCGKPIEKIPNWMQAISVAFVCNNCPNRQHKNIAFVNLDASQSTAVKETIPDEIGEDAEADVELLEE